MVCSLVTNSVAVPFLAKMCMVVTILYFTISLDVCVLWAMSISNLPSWVRFLCVFCSPMEESDPSFALTFCMIYCIIMFTIYTIPYLISYNNITIFTFMSTEREGESWFVRSLCTHKNKKEVTCCRRLCCPIERKGMGGWELYRLRRGTGTGTRTMGIAETD